jgi:3-oxoacyl-[acyl-carrier protein] reductase
VLEGMTAVVTGGSRGIGRAIVERLCRDGANVVFNYATSEEAAAEVIRTVQANGGRAHAVRADLTDPEALEQLMQTAEAHLGGLDILVNNAALSYTPAPLAETARPLRANAIATAATRTTINAAAANSSTRQPTPRQACTTVRAPKVANTRSSRS